MKEKAKNTMTRLRDGMSPEDNIMAREKEILARKRGMASLLMKSPNRRRKINFEGRD